VVKLNTRKVQSRDDSQNADVEKIRRVRAHPANRWSWSKPLQNARKWNECHRAGSRDLELSCFIRHAEPMHIFLLSPSLYVLILMYTLHRSTVLHTYSCTHSINRKDTHLFAHVYTQAYAHTNHAYHHILPSSFVYLPTSNRHCLCFEFS